MEIYGVTIEMSKGQWWVIADTSAGLCHDTGFDNLVDAQDFSLKFYRIEAKVNT